MTYATRAAIDANKTSPANTLPKRRKESEAILANSPIISNKPTKNVTGAVTITILSLFILVNISPSTFRLTHLLKVFQMPIEKMPKRFAPTTAKLKYPEPIINKNKKENRNSNGENFHRKRTAICHLVTQ